MIISHHIQAAPMTPEDVCASLSHPSEPLPPAPGDLPPARASAVLVSITSTYFMLRRGMALLAFALPVILWAGGGLEGSLSAYYHADGGRMRDVFVGVLWAIGACLLLYRGYSTAEDRALDGAGVAVVAVALAPTDWPRDAADTLTGVIHHIAAAVFFLLIAYVCMARSGDTLAAMRDLARAARFRATYRVLGLLMALAPAAAWVAHLLLPRRADAPVLFFVEAAAVYVFAVFWTIKGREIRLLERQ